MNKVYVLLRLDTSRNPMNWDVNIDRHEATAHLSYEGAKSMMEAAYNALVKESDFDHFCEGDEAFIETDEHICRRWKIQLAGVTP